VWWSRGRRVARLSQQRAVRSLIHWYWAPDGGVGGTMIVKVPLWNEQDLDMGLFDKIIRALAFQYVCVWPGPCAITQLLSGVPFF